MKLKYYLRGIGIGVILTAIIMGFALGGRKATISDAQVIERAKELGMTEGGVLTDGSGEVKNNGATLSSSSGETLDEAGKEISEEIDETVALASESISTLVKEEEERENKESKDTADSANSSSEAVTLVSKEKEDSSSMNASSKENEDTSTTGKSETKTEESTAAASANTSVNASSEETTQAVASSVNTEPTTVTIPGGLSSDGVAQVLYNAGVIDNASSFNRYLIDQGKDRIIRSGTKVIPAGATYAEIAAIITR
jgi:hypothetical protein